MRNILTALAIVLGMSAPAMAFNIPVWSGAPIATPDDDGVRNVNGAVNKTDSHGNIVSHTR